MAQIIRHRKGVLESVASATKRKAELLVVTGSSASSIDTGLLFIGTEGGAATVANKVHTGAVTPDLTGADYDTSIDGIPFYNTTEKKYYILKKGGNIEVKASANTDGTGLVSSSAQIDQLGFLKVNSDSVVSGSEQITVTNTTGFTAFSSSLKATDDAQNVRLGQLEAFSSSLDGDFATDAELIAISGAVASTIDALTTDEVAEGSNLYFTDARVKTKLTAEGVISGSSQVQIDDVTGFTSFSSSADSRISTIETSLGEGGGIGGRVETLESFATDAGASVVELYATSSDQEGRLDIIEAKTLVSSSAQIVTRLSNQSVNFGSGDIVANSFSGNGSNLTNIPLGTATTGDYVDSLVAGTGITLTNNSGEGSTPTIATAQDISDSASPTFADLTLTGDLSVSGTTTTTNQTTLTVSDSKIFLADGNVGDSLDSAIIFNYNDGEANTAGMFRDATDGSITIFGSYTGSSEVGNTIDVTADGYSLGVIKAAEFDGAVEWSNIANKPDTELTIALSGSVAGNGTVVFNELGDASLTITSSIPADTNLTLNDLVIDGSLTVTGTTTSTNVSTVSSDNPLVILNSSGGGNPDVGIIGQYDVDGSTIVNGFFRDATDGKWKVFDGSTQSMSDSALINTANAGYGLGVIQAGSFSGSLDFSYLENVPAPSIEISASGDLSGSAVTTLTDLQDGILNLDLSIPTTSNLTFNSLDITSDLSVVGNISVDNIEASGDITSSAGAQIGTNLTVGGDATVSGDISADNLTLSGNLTVQGTTTSVNSTTIELGDNIIELNGTGATNGGLLVNDTDGPLNGSLLWDGASNFWKAGGAGEESRILVVGGMSVVSGSSQINASETFGWSTDFKSELDANTVISGSSQVNLANVTGNSTSNVTEGTNLYYTQDRVKFKLNTDGVISGSSQVSLSGVQGDTSDIDEGSNLYFTDARVKTKLDVEGVVTGSEQITLGDVTGFTSYSSSVDTRISNLSGNLNTSIKTKLDAENVVSSSAQVIEHLVGNNITTGEITGSNLLLSGNAKIDGNIVLGGNITIGDSTTDSIAFNADLESDIIPNLGNTYDLGSEIRPYAEIHGVNLYGALKASNNVVSSSAATANVEMTVSNGVVSAELKGGVVSGSSQVVSLLADQATDFGTGRVSGDNFGDAAGTSTFTGSFVGDGSQLTGLVTDLRISGSTGDDVVSLLSDDLTFAGGTAISVDVTDNTITVNADDASTSAKGIASFDADDFSVTSGNVAIKDGGVRAANFNADVVGTGISLNGADNSLDVDYGSTAGTAVQGNTTISVSGTANEVEITGTTSQALGGGVSYTVGLPSDVTIGNDIQVTNDAAVGGNLTVTGNLSVLGTTTTVDSTTVQIGDNVLELNYGGAQTTAGLLVTDSTAPNTASGSLVWNGVTDVWTAGPLGSEKELARLNSAPTANTVLKADANGLLVDSVMTDDGTDATFSGDVIVDGLTASSFLYADANKQLTAITPSNAGDVIQWNGSSFVASNELDGGTF